MTFDLETRKTEDYHLIKAAEQKILKDKQDNKIERINKYAKSFFYGSNK